MQRWLRMILILVLAPATRARAETVLEKVLAPYDSVQSMSCEIRRDTPLPDGNPLRMLSRVYYQRPDNLQKVGQGGFQQPVIEGARLGPPVSGNLLACPPQLHPT